ncbi:MAG: hypothetical protein J0I98_18205 [Mesorhizobium sp.]|nr:hypothetical protein [Mesorhizobium sp.]MBN9244721.1 hypothetical protein [Mesorhizobium sp.]
MIGAALSRWTMAYFAAAFGFLLLAEALMACGYGFPAVAIEAPETLVLVHVAAIGWLSLLMCGALFQFVPVLVAQPLQGGRLVLPALACLLAGLACLLAGFLALAGTVAPHLPAFPIAGVLLAAGFGLMAWIVGRTLWSARSGGLPMPARFVAVGLACLLATAALGVTFVLVLSGLLPQAAGVLAHGLPAHAAAGLAGWLTFTAIGVSYRLLPMFMLAPDGARRTTHLAWWCGSAALLLAVVAVPLEQAVSDSWLAAALAGLCGCVALSCYGADLVFFYRNRRRKAIELNSRSAVAAFACLCLTVLLALGLLAFGDLGRYAGALVFLAAFGWLSGLGLSQLYKIVPFLTWLECYGPVMGRKPTPRVQDLVAERRDGPWFILYFAAVVAGTVMLLADRPDFFRLAAGLMLTATAAIGLELVLARRLFNVAEDKRLPEGTVRPRLFLATPR